MSESSSMRWWGWGEPGNGHRELPQTLLEVLRQRLGVDGSITSSPAALDDVALPKSQLTDDVRERLARVVGEEQIRQDPGERVRHAVGRSYLDLLALRSGKLEFAPDAVIYPGDEQQVAAVLMVCGESNVAVVPFGGGTSVVGGLDALRGSHQSVLCMDLRRISGIVSLDAISELATVRAGTRATDCERHLAEHGFTLGHFPQSHEFASIGGYAATRSAGQASSGYGRFDEMVLGLRCVTPTGVLAVDAHPSTGAGPSLLETILGSEGTLGVITEVTVRIHRRPDLPHYEGWSFPTFIDGTEAIRSLAQSGLTPDLIRLSDEAESEMALALSPSRGVVRAAGNVYLHIHGQKRGCIAIVGWDRDAQAQTARREAASRVLGRGGGVPLGSGPGKTWQAGRFAAPYMRDQLLDRGVLAETLETATSWSNMSRLKAVIAKALRESLTMSGREPIVGFHLSHVYPTGASLYVTILAKQSSDPVAQWQSSKAAVTKAIVENGGTLTHHHAVGTQHAPWMVNEVGDAGIRALQALRREFDPAGIMNPGKLTPTLWAEASTTPS